jgi:hypothetical protein
MIIDLSKKTGHPWNGEMTDKMPVAAWIDFSRWLASCECGSASYVTDKDKFFYCPTCGNSNTQGKARAVIFPDNKKDIEAELLRRNVRTSPGFYGTHAAISAKGILPRSWSPGETIQNLIDQRKGK